MSETNSDKKSNRSQVELTPLIAHREVQIGNFWCPEQLDALSQIILQEVAFFYTPERIKQYLIPLVTQQSEVSGRTLDWLVTNYSKKNVIVYRWKVFENRDAEIINIHTKYNEWLVGYCRRGFDPFRRSKRIYFEKPDSKISLSLPMTASNTPMIQSLIDLPDASCTEPQIVYATTVGQLNFFYFAWIYGIYNYALKNNNMILDNMKETMNTVQVLVDKNGKPCRRQLTRAPTFKCSIFKMSPHQDGTEMNESCLVVGTTRNALMEPSPFHSRVSSTNDNESQQPIHTLTLSRPVSSGVYKLTKKRKEIDPNLPKRPRGRPRKHPRIDDEAQPATITQGDSTISMSDETSISTIGPKSGHIASVFDVDDVSALPVSENNDAPSMMRLASSSSSSSSTYTPLHVQVPDRNIQGLESYEDTSIHAPNTPTMVLTGHIPHHREPPSTARPKRSKTPIDPNVPKRKRGRPRKVLTPEEEAVRMQKKVQEDEDPYKAMGIENPNSAMSKRKKPQKQRVKTFNTQGGNVGIKDKPEASSTSTRTKQVSNPNNDFLAKDDSAMLEWFVQ